MNIAALIAQVRSMEPKGASVADYRTLFDQIANGHIFASLIPRGGLWYRARQNLGQELFITKKDLWYPSAERVRLNRANDSGKPVLYLANDGATALREISFASGDWVTILACRVSPGADLKLQEIGLCEHVRKGNLPVVSQEVDWRIANAHAQGFGDRINHPLVRNYFVEKFTQIVGQDEDHLYKPTAAVASLLMSYAECDGIAYPAMKSDKQEVNIALKPESADRKLEAVSVDVVQAFHLPDGEIAVQQLFTASEFTSVGSITYLDAQRRTAALPWVDKNRPTPS